MSHVKKVRINNNHIMFEFDVVNLIYNYPVILEM